MAQRWQQKLWMKTCGTLCEPVNLDGFPYFSFLVGMKCRFNFILTAKYGTDCRAAPVCPHFWALVVNKMEMMWQGIFAILRANPNGLCERVEANSTWACWEHICCRLCLSIPVLKEAEHLLRAIEMSSVAAVMVRVHMVQELSWAARQWFWHQHWVMGGTPIPDSWHVSPWQSLVGCPPELWVGCPSQILDISAHCTCQEKMESSKGTKKTLEIKSREEVGLIWRPKGRVDAPGFQWHAAVRGEENIFSCCLHVNGFMNIQNKWTFGKRDF